MSAELPGDLYGVVAVGSSRLSEGRAATIAGDIHLSDESIRAIKFFLPAPDLGMHAHYRQADAYFQLLNQMYQKNSLRAAFVARVPGKNDVEYASRAIDVSIDLIEICQWPVRLKSDVIALVLTLKCDLPSPKVLDEAPIGDQDRIYVDDRLLLVPPGKPTVCCSCEHWQHLTTEHGYFCCAMHPSGPAENSCGDYDKKTNALSPMVLVSSILTEAKLV